MTKTTFIKRHLKISLLSSLGIYLILSFCYWDFMNPINFILNIPEMDTTDRSMTLFFYTMYHITIGMAVFMNEDLKTK